MHRLLLVFGVRVHCCALGKVSRSCCRASEMAAKGLLRLSVSPVFLVGRMASLYSCRNVQNHTSYLYRYLKPTISTASSTRGLHSASRNHGDAKETKVNVCTVKNLVGLEC